MAWRRPASASEPAIRQPEASDDRAAPLRAAPARQPAAQQGPAPRPCRPSQILHRSLGSGAVAVEALQWRQRAWCGRAGSGPGASRASRAGSGPGAGRARSGLAGQGELLPQLLLRRARAAVAPSARPPAGGLTAVAAHGAHTCARGWVESGACARASSPPRILQQREPGEERRGRGARKSGRGPRAGCAGAGACAGRDQMRARARGGGREQGTGAGAGTTGHSK
jgi:hypothetical protein